MVTRSGQFSKKKICYKLFTIWCKPCIPPLCYSRFWVILSLQYLLKSIHYQQREQPSNWVDVLAIIFKHLCIHLDVYMWYHILVILSSLKYLITGEVVFTLNHWTNSPDLPSIFPHKIVKLMSKIILLFKILLPNLYKPWVSGICSQICLYLLDLLLLLYFIIFL